MRIHENLLKPLSRLSGLGSSLITLHNGECCSFAVQVVITHNEKIPTHLIKGPARPEFRRSPKRRRMFSLRVLSVYLKARHHQSAMQSGCYAVHSSRRAVHSYKIWRGFCIDCFKHSEVARLHSTPEEVENAGFPF